MIDRKAPNLSFKIINIPTGSTMMYIKNKITRKLE